MKNTELISNNGQSIWLDYISRKDIQNGDLERIIKDCNVVGLTSNPTIFESAIVNTDAYDNQIKTLAMQGKKVEDIYESLVFKDIRDACDLLLDTYHKTNNENGYVSLELPPYLSDDLQGTLEKARFYWQEVNRPNLMIKIPATDVGVEALEILTQERINTNATLLFSLDQYKKVSTAFIKGVSKCGQEEGYFAPSSVASFFISRIDKVLDEYDSLESGKAAVNNALAAYSYYFKSLDTKEWILQEEMGAQPQRLLWASTSIKNEEYKPTKYIEELALSNTVNTVPLSLLKEVNNIEGDYSWKRMNLKLAEEYVNMLKSNYDFDNILNDLLIKGLESFNNSYLNIIQAITNKLDSV